MATLSGSAVLTMTATSAAVTVWEDRGLVAAEAPKVQAEIATAHESGIESGCKMTSPSVRGLREGQPLRRVPATVSAEESVPGPTCRSWDPHAARQRDLCTRQRGFPVERA